MKKISILIMAVLLVGSLVLAGCNSNSNSDEKNDKLIVYSSRNERFAQNLLDKFTQDTGIEVSALHGANPLQILEEKNNVQADIFISNDMGALGFLDQNDLLKGDEYELIDSIPEQFRSENNSYFAISTRARGFIYNKDLITYEEMPKSIEDLFDSKWAEIDGGFAITNGGNGGMIGHISALRFEWGDEKTGQLITALKENAAGIYQGHSDIRRSVGSGEHTFGLVNNYYFHQQLLESENNNVGFVYLDQEHDQMGAVVNAAGLGIVKDGPNEANAKKFVEWILEPENQVAFVGESLEVLINSEYEVEYPQKVAEVIVPFNKLKIQGMPLKELGNYFEDTKELLERYGLDLELR